MSNVNKSENFTSIEDHIVSQECTECGGIFDTEEELENCPTEDCEGDEFTITTSLEGTECNICGYHFEPYSSNAYQHDQTSEIICSSCYNDLVDAENDEDFDEEDENEEETASSNEPVLLEMPDLFRNMANRNNPVQTSNEEFTAVGMPEVFRTVTPVNTPVQDLSEQPATMEMPEVFRRNTSSSSPVQTSEEEFATVEMPEVFRTVVPTNVPNQDTLEQPPTMEMPEVFKFMIAERNLTSTTQHNESVEEVPRNHLRVISHRLLSNKTIRRVSFAEWNGATVIETTDNCVCVMYSSYNHLSRRQEFEELDSVADYKRLILGIE